MEEMKVSAWRWVRSFNDPVPTNAALSGALKYISDSTADCSMEADGCPVFDMALGSKAHSTPRLPFLVTSALDGAGALGNELPRSTHAAGLTRMMTGLTRGNA